MPLVKLNEREIKLASLRSLLCDAMDAKKKGIRARQIDLMAQVIIIFKENDFDYTAADLGRILKLKFYMYRMYAIIRHLQDLGIVRYYRKVGNVDTYQLRSWKPDYVCDDKEYENNLKTKEIVRV